MENPKKSTPMCITTQELKSEEKVLKQTDKCHLMYMIKIIQMTVISHQKPGNSEESSTFFKYWKEISTLNFISGKNILQKCAKKPTLKEWVKVVLETGRRWWKENAVAEKMQVLKVTKR